MANNKTAQYGDYTISIDESGAVKVTHNGSECKNTIAALRDIANQVGFPYETKWNTQQFGSKLINFLNNPKTHNIAAQDLIEIVQQDIFAFLESNEELLFNERDLQMHLATWLRNSANTYDDVDVEYYVPCSELERLGYIWKSELRLDVVVKKDGEYCPIELKYKTKKVERQISRFDEILDVVVMKNQGAQDLGMYDFWKDVRRIELVRKRFKHIKGGLAVFVTNDEFYKKESNKKSNNYLFNMSANKAHPKQKHWANSESTCTKNRPSFEVDREYSIKWHQKDVDNVTLYYCIVNI